MPSLYLDCDGFFAACEESADPALHGRPVAVSTLDPDNRAAILIAINTTAKRRHLAKGTHAEHARARVPDLTVIHQHPELYVATHRAIVDAVETVLPGAQSHSIDELSVELQPDDPPAAVLRSIKTAIGRAVGPIITVSCAIAPNTYLAKTAAEKHKPDAAAVWRTDDIPGVYGTLELADLPGLGPATEARLRAHGIDTVTALYHAEPPAAVRAWGSILGARVHAALHGRTIATRPPSRRRLSHARELEPSLRSWTRARPIARFLTTCLVHRCRQATLAPTRLTLETLGTDRTGWKATTPRAPTNHDRDALLSITALWDATAAEAHAQPARISVTASQLLPWPSPQHTLFEHPGSELQHLLDTVRTRYGAKAITLGESSDYADSDLWRESGPIAVEEEETTDASRRLR